MISQQFTHGLVRTVSRSLAKCELLHVPRQSFDLEQARSQHSNYVATLNAHGIRVTVLPEEPALPDATFVEDAVIILDEVAVVCRLGCLSRETEAAQMEPALERIRAVHRIAAPGTIEGGDVLKIGKTLFVGASSRTNESGIRQLQEIVSRFGYRVVITGVNGCLHLKTGITCAREDILIANGDWIDLRPFEGFEIISVPVTEPWGANTLPVNGTVIVAESAPRTADLLERRGMQVERVDISELQKAEAGLTCLSVLFREERGGV